MSSYMQTTYNIIFFATKITIEISLLHHISQQPSKTSYPVDILLRWNPTDIFH